MQTDLFDKYTTQQDKLFMKRKIIYNELLNELHLLELRKKSMIHQYNIAVQEIDKDSEALRLKKLVNKSE